MTLTNRLRSFFTRTTSLPAPTATIEAPLTRVVSQPPGLREQSSSEPLPLVLSPFLTRTDPLPTWLADEESLRDEGVLFGLSDARPDGKLAQIRAYFGQQSAPLDEQIEQHTEKIGELNLFIEQRENRIITLRNQISDLHDTQPVSNNLVRHVVSLALSVVLCIGNFYLIDETLRPVFANRWIAVGVFIAGMFNLFGRTSFFYETDTRLTGRRLVEELSLPLATAIFVLVQALHSQAVGQAIGLFVFVFFLFLLAGKLVLSTLTSLQTDVSGIQSNHRLTINKLQNLPRWEADIERLSQEIDSIRAQKWPIVTTLNHLQAEMTRLNTQRDGLVNLFISEFELARSLRNRLTEQQRKSMMNYE
ncbi:hypothetical protein EXU85_12720 [Spirosoma sp. KCTC 42546]|uniref:hypothetical protein n=1 Tax=Spirosoma sp. KCTC 42546 TaxID=2520506 RepID=UPI0011583872|nr:hypothetical protein [Spirosoma sp. KCTC 42546]QDK79419.1 hypothetical protein EXU85_12720 [Spirosoma sp. KCTC 42546]